MDELSHKGNIRYSWPRAEEVSSKQCMLLKPLFIPLVLFVVIYIYTGHNTTTIRTSIIYPHPKKKPLNGGLPTQNDAITEVNSHKMYMAGSYVEHRQEVKMIRTIAIVLRSDPTTYHCLLRCNGQTVSVNATVDIHPDHFGYDYGTADINCKIPKQCTAPTHIAITRQSTENDGSLNEIHTFQPVRNQKEAHVFPYKFTVCVSVMYEYKNILQFVQTMEMFRMLGVQKVVIYKTSCYGDMLKVLEYYVKLKFVEIIPWTISSYVNVSRGWQKSVSPGELHYFGQIAALNDCVYRYMYQSHYVALQDLDELILPMNLKDWTQLLPELEKRYSQVSGFEFENNIFPLSLKDSNSKYSPKFWGKIEGENILQHIVKISNDPTEFNNFKVIVNPRFVFKATVHGILHHIRGTVRVDSQIARMYHIRNVENEELQRYNQIPDPHLRDYADFLIPAVSEVLEKALFIYKSA